jgi:hypothetical protein
MGSIIFTDDEARYIKAMLSWDAPSSDNEKNNDLKSALEAEVEARRRQPVGEFRILVAGAKGVGKTAILTRVSIRIAQNGPRTNKKASVFFFY